MFDALVMRVKRLSVMSLASTKLGEYRPVPLGKMA